MRNWTKVAAKTALATAGFVAFGSGLAHAETDGRFSVLGGNQFNAPISVPINISGNSLAGGGVANAESPAGAKVFNGDGHGFGGHGDETSGKFSVGGGNQTNAPVSVPINICGNAASLAGIAKAVCGDGAKVINEGRGHKPDHHDHHGRDHDHHDHGHGDEHGHGHGRGHGRQHGHERGRARREVPAASRSAGSDRGPQSPIDGLLPGAGLPPELTGGVAGLLSAAGGGQTGRTAAGVPGLPVPDPIVPPGVGSGIPIGGSAAGIPVDGLLNRSLHTGARRAAPAAPPGRGLPPRAVPADRAAGPYSLPLPAGLPVAPPAAPYSLPLPTLGSPTELLTRLLPDGLRLDGLANGPEPVPTAGTG